MTAAGVRTSAAVLVAAGCIPDYGRPLDAGTERRPAIDLAGIDATVPADAPATNEAPIPSECAPVNHEVKLIGFSSSYDREEVTVPAGSCVRICFENSGSERHTHSSDERLFPDVVTTTGETACRVYSRVLDVGRYGITCREHQASMTVALVVQ